MARFHPTTALADASTEQRFVTLWTWVRAHLREVNAAVRNGGEHPVNLMPTTEPLESLSAPGQLGAVEVAQWLKRLDIELSDPMRRGDAANIDPRSYVGVDGQSYVLRLRNNWPDRIKPYGDAVQDGITAYARRCVAINPELPGAIALREVELPAALRRKLALCATMPSFPVLLWASHPAGLSSAIQKGEQFLVVQPTPADALDQPLLAQIDAALAAARTAEAALLILPELCCSPVALAHLQAELAENPSPLITVVGMFHSPAAQKALMVNEAVVLDDRGNELFRHQKTASFGTADGSGHALGEQLAQGAHLTVMATPVGNMTVAICAELFAGVSKPALLASHASLVTSPSFSPSTGPHAAAAAELDAAMCATTLCTNTSEAGPSPAGGESFVRVNGKSARASPGQHAFVFDLLSIGE